MIIVALWKIYLEGRTLVLVLDGYDSFINDDEEGIDKGKINEDRYQGPPDSSDIDEIIDNCDGKRLANYYDQYIGAEDVLPDQKGEKKMEKVRKCAKYHGSDIVEGNYNPMHENYFYGVEYPDGTT